MGRSLSAEDVSSSVQDSKNGKAAGLDGIIYELWKVLDARFRAAPADARGTLVFDVTDAMRKVFTDVEDYGLPEGSRFAEGWLCPLYKKGERSEIANYRPITLLNTDYKLYTKILAMRLAMVASRVIHPSQAGFVQGRSIADHTKVTSLLLDLAEADDQDGAIVALDQEKAYDRVRHDYLLKILAAFGLPPRFVRAVANLYSSAHTSVMVNGMLSSR
ncbi:hypothetical protein AURDEDRAFT_75188, partial [Auricularia subglabra TFB-10046 SS5]